MMPIIKDKQIKQTIFDFLWEYNYIFNNQDCDCPFRQKTITFKNRFGKRFDRRLLKFSEVFGFEASSGPTADLTILPESQQKFDEMNEMIMAKIIIKEKQNV